MGARAIPPRAAAIKGDGWYELTLHGQKIGYAQQLLVVDGERAVARYAETVLLRRGDAPLAIATRYKLSSDGRAWEGTTSTVINGDARTLPLHSAIGIARGDEACPPAIIVPGWLALDRPTPACSVDPPRDHLTLRLSVVRRDEGVQQLRWHHPWGDLVTEVVSPPGAMPTTITAGDGLEARRVPAAQAQTPWTPPDLLELTAVRATRLASHRRGALVLRLDRGAVPAPLLAQEAQLFPGQEATDDGQHVTYHLTDHALPSSAISHQGSPLALADVRRIVGDVRAELTPSLASGAGFGDCTAVTARLARALGDHVPHRIATGWRYDDTTGLLIRHRWLVVLTTKGWRSIDPTFGEVPAKPRLIGLVHEAPTTGAPIGDLVFAIQPAASTPPSRDE